jgi:hypothetical protein
MLLVNQGKKMDLKNHEPNFWALIIILVWLIMIVTIIVYK